MKKSTVVSCFCSLFIMLNLFVAVPLMAQEKAPEYFIEMVKVPNIAGKWSGAWTSSTGGSGSLLAKISQKGSKISGKLSVTNTDCGYYSNVPFSGAISGKVVTFKIKTSCGSQKVEMKFTKGTISSNNKRIAGKYSTYVDGSLYDRGKFNLTK